MNVPITQLKGPLPLGPIIRASELARYFDGAAVVASARTEADALLEHARAMLANAECEAHAIRERAREEGLADAQSSLEAMRTALIAETVEWCIAESELETTVTTRLGERIESVIAEVLSGFIAEQDAVERLMRRVSEQLRQVHRQGLITLRVASDVIDAARGACERETLSHCIDVVSDAALTGGCAIIETPLVKIRIDVDSHLDAVLSLLRNHPKE